MCVSDKNPELVSVKNSRLIPTNPEIDLSYLVDYGSRDKYTIPTWFDFEGSSFKRGQSFEARITQVYDISKFWIVIKHRELEIFQKSLFRFYYMNQARYKIPVNKLTKNLYCIAFMDNAYFRGVIVGFPITCRDEEKQQVHVYFIDYGLVGSVTADNIFYMSKKCLQMPQFAIRASLALICPSKSDSWTSYDVTNFCNLIKSEVLVGVIVNVDNKRHVLTVKLGIKNDNGIDLIHEALIKQKCARFWRENEETESETSPLKYPFMFPTHEALESGLIPTKISDAEYQEQITFTPFTSIYVSYCKRDQVNGRVENSV